jgi:hypothetical protein
MAVVLDVFVSSSAAVQSARTTGGVSKQRCTHAHLAAAAQQQQQQQQQQQPVVRCE